MGQNDFDHITPARLDLNLDDDTALPGHRQRPSWQGYILAVFATLAVAGLAFLLLPRLITPVELAPRQGATNDAAIVQSGAADPARNRAQSTQPQISPFEQAQRERERADAKTALDALLEIQFQLKEQQVERWAAEDYARAMELARSGDESYRANAFVEARDGYAAASAALQAIADSVPARLDEALSAGADALNALDAQTATDAFTTALAIDPANTRAEQGLKRAATLDRVVEAFQRGETLERDGDVDAALAAYKEALAIDPQFVPARNNVDRLNAQQRDADFNEQMSAAYAALSDNNPDGALVYFNRALKVRPDSSEARDGRSQAQFQISQQQIARHLDRAQKAEASEQWSRAVKEYDAALEIDSGLAPALNGKRDAATRAALDARLQRIAAPESPILGNDAIAAAEKLVRAAGSIPKPGPRLKAQLEDANTAIAAAKTPIAVNFGSDGVTDVTVFRIGNLGSFENHTMALKPGDYVAVGQRVGYRDVRIEFQVRAGMQPPTVTVSCTRRI